MLTRNKTHQVTVYAVDLFQDAGFGEELSKLLAGFNNLSYMFSVIFAVYTLDRFGRRCKSCIACSTQEVLR